MRTDVIYTALFISAVSVYWGEGNSTDVIDGATNSRNETPTDNQVSANSFLNRTNRNHLQSNSSFGITNQTRSGIREDTSLAHFSRIESIKEDKSSATENSRNPKRPVDTDKDERSENGIINAQPQPKIIKSGSSPTGDGASVHKALTRGHIDRYLASGQMLSRDPVRRNAQGNSSKPMSSPSQVSINPEEAVFSEYVVAVICVMFALSVACLIVAIVSKRSAVPVHVQTFSTRWVEKRVAVKKKSLSTSQLKDQEDDEPLDMEHRARRDVLRDKNLGNIRLPQDRTTKRYKTIEQLYPQVRDRRIEAYMRDQTLPINKTSLRYKTLRNVYGELRGEKGLPTTLSYSSIRKGVSANSIKGPKNARNTTAKGRRASLTAILGGGSTKKGRMGGDIRSIKRK